MQSVQSIAAVGAGVLPAARVPRLSLIWWAVWVLLAGLSAAVFVPAYLNHDAAWYLHMVGRMLGGATLYRDVVDTNPPFILLMTLPAMWLAAFGIGVAAAFKAWVFALSLASLFVSAPLARRMWPGASDLSRGLLVSALVFVVLPLVRTDFGQREHLLILLVLPYVMAAISCTAGAPVSRRIAVPIGIIGGLGFAMKPHYLLGWLAVETALVAIRPRAGSWRRAEAVAAAGAIVAYALSVVIFVPRYVMVAESARQVYGGLNSSAALLMRLPDTQVCVAAVALLALVRLPRTARVVCLVLLAAAVGLLLAALLQLKGWSYHLYPARVFEVLFFVTFAVGAVEGLPSVAAALRGGARSIAALAVAVLLVSAGRYVLEARRPVDLDLVTPLIATIRAQAPHGPVAVLSMRTIIYPAFPAVTYTGARWSLRHNSLWFLPGLYTGELQMPDAARRFRKPEAMGPLEREFYEEVITDLCADPPALLLVEPAEPRAPAGRRALDLTAYYGQDPRYRRLWGVYQPLGTIGPFAVYHRSAAATCR